MGTRADSGRTRLESTVTSDPNRVGSTATPLDPRAAGPYLDGTTGLYYILDYHPFDSDELLFRSYDANLQLVDSITFERGDYFYGFIDDPIRAYQLLQGPTIRRWSSRRVLAQRGTEADLQFATLTPSRSTFSWQPSPFDVPLGIGDVGTRSQYRVGVNGREYLVTNYGSAQELGIQVRELIDISSGIYGPAVNVPRDSFETDMYVYAIGDSLHVVALATRATVSNTHYVFGQDLTRWSRRSTPTPLPTASNIVIWDSKFQDHKLEYVQDDSGALSLVVSEPDARGIWRIRNTGLGSADETLRNAVESIHYRRSDSTVVVLGNRAIRVDGALDYNYFTLDNSFNEFSQDVSPYFIVVGPEQSSHTPQPTRDADDITPLVAYPNPTATGHVVIELGETTSTPLVGVTDLFGRSVAHTWQPRDASSIELSLDAPTEGLYLINVGQRVAKVLVQRP